ncbi:MAG: hypothetical protein K8R88_00675 [Armatimonadetes bacterium]|nr:hypothetical protein [Armatimonadota bacterium]
MLQTISLIVLAIIGLYFIGLGVFALFSPALAQKFLLGFATTLFKHYLELAIRFIAGASFLLYAPKTGFPEVFSIIGWVLLTTTFGLLVIPFRWHEKFAKKAVPAALKYLKVIGISSLAVGSALLYAISSGW